MRRRFRGAAPRLDVGGAVPYTLTVVGALFQGREDVGNGDHGATPLPGSTRTVAEQQIQVCPQDAVDQLADPAGPLSSLSSSSSVAVAVGDAGLVLIESQPPNDHDVAPYRPPLPIEKGAA